MTASDRNDVRLKMCIEITGEDFLTVHHELGHNFYQRAYSKMPPSFRDSANDGFRSERRPPQDVHRDHGRGFPDGSPRTGPQFLPAGILQAAALLPRQR